MDGCPHHLIVSSNELSQRLDQFLSIKFSEHSRAYFQTLIAEGLVLVNGKAAKKRTRLEAGDEVSVTFASRPQIDLIPEPIPLNILYEDDALIIVNKPAGLVVHPGAGNYSGTFAQGLLYHCKSLPATDPLRPGIVHRLDRDTSGALVAAKTEEAHQKLVTQFANKEVRKTYLALCIGNPGARTIEKPLGRHPVDRKKRHISSQGKAATTHVKPLAQEQGIALVEIDLETGRTHQIRVHLRSIGCPVLGDGVYGDAGMNKKWAAGRQMLHACHIALRHPIRKTPIEIAAPLPADFAALCHRLTLQSPARWSRLGETLSDD